MGRIACMAGGDSRRVVRGGKSGKGQTFLFIPIGRDACVGPAVSCPLALACGLRTSRSLTYFACCPPTTDLTTASRWPANFAKTDHGPDSSFAAQRRCVAVAGWRCLADGVKSAGASRHEADQSKGAPERLPRDYRLPPKHAGRSARRRRDRARGPQRCPPGWQSNRPPRHRGRPEFESIRRPHRKRKEARRAR